MGLPRPIGLQGTMRVPFGDSSGLLGLLKVLGQVLFGTLEAPLGGPGVVSNGVLGRATVLFLAVKALAPRRAERPHNSILGPK